MNILELDSYNLADAVKFNDRLNPKLWGPDERLKPEVREQLLRIADDFREFLGVTDLELKDITISGSNAAYTYTPYSDIDLHLVVDLPEADRNEVYRELFDAKKYQYNDMHDFKIGRYDIELYVENANKKPVSQGIYSVLNNEWVDVPKRQKAMVDDVSTRNKYEDLSQRIDAAVKSNSLEQMDTLAKKIKELRQAGLDAHGEFGPENLAFKMLRTQGKIKELYDARNRAKDQELSLKERRKPGSVFTYGFKHEDVVNEVSLTPDGVSPETCMFLDDTSENTSDEDILKDFIDFCAKELKLEHMPTIKLRRDPQWPVVHKTFGRYVDDKHTLEVAWGQRHIMDVLRTVAHELTHKHQHERDGEAMGADAGETGSKWENEANARAGILMRDYGRLHPEFYKKGQAQELHGDEVKEGYGVRTSAGKKIVAKQNELIDGRKFVSQGYTIEFTPTALEIRRGADLVYRKEGNYANPTRQNLASARNITTMLASKYTAGNVKESASGYIPTKKQARDPRYVMALTKDVQPGAVGKEANKLRLKTDSQGHPQQARTDGLFEELMFEYKKYKRAEEDYSPNTPPGPEFKPTMPRGTVRVDVSDMYDWYKLGQNISNLRGADKSRFGKGPPSTIVSFGDEETEHKYIKDLENLGLTTTDIDPIDLKQPPGMPRQKTDPTYNVDEDELMEFDPAGYGERYTLYIDDYNTQETFADLEDAIQAVEEYKRDDPKSQYADYNIRDLSGEVLWRNDAWQDVRRPGRIQFLPPGQDLKEADTVDRLQKQLNAFKRGELLEAEELDEVRMAPSNLKQFANSEAAEGIRAGFEAELIFRDTESDSESDDLEPDYDYDERTTSLRQIIEFFSNDDWGYGLSQREQNRLEEDLDEAYYEWYDEQMHEAWQDERDDKIREAFLEEQSMHDRVHAVLVDGMELTDEEADRIQDVGEKAPRFTKSVEQDAYTAENPDYKVYLEAVEDAEAILDEEVESCLASEDSFYDSVLDQFRDDFYISDDSGFFTDKGWRWMSDIADEFNLNWPYYTGGSNGGDRDWDSIADSLSEVVGMPVKVSSGYHSATRKEGLWILEPDSSLDPDEREDVGLEIVSPPMPLKQALEKLQAVTDWANGEGNAYTNESTGLHMGVSIPYKGGNVDYLKLIMFLGDEYVLEQFGRESNHYTKAAMREIRSKAGSEKNAQAVMELLKNNLLELAERELARSTGVGKYTSAHKHGEYIEFRSAGGDWLAEDNVDPEKLPATMMRYAYAMYLAGRPDLERKEYAKKLYKLVANGTDDSTMALFSQFATGMIDKDQLKKQWAEKTLSKEAPKEVEKGEWVVVNKSTNKPVQGQSYNGYTKDEVRARAKQKLSPASSDTDFDLHYSVEPQNTGRWEIYSFDADNDRPETEQTLEIVDAANRGAAADAVYDKYNAQKIPFKVRPYYGDKQSGPQKELSPRAKLAKRIVQKPKQQVGNADSKAASDWEAVWRPTGRVVDTLAHADAEQATNWRQMVIRQHGFEDNGDLIIRRAGEQSPDVAQNFSAQTPPDATQQVGSWSIYDVTLGREVSRMSDVSWQQATDRAEELERNTGHSMSVRGLN